MYKLAKYSTSTLMFQKMLSQKFSINVAELFLVVNSASIG